VLVEGDERAERPGGEPLRQEHVRGTVALERPVWHEPGRGALDRDLLIVLDHDPGHPVVRAVRDGKRVALSPEAPGMLRP
jgi:hypothetical protein